MHGWFVSGHQNITTIATLVSTSPLTVCTRHPCGTSHCSYICTLFSLLGLPFADSRQPADTPWVQVLSNGRSQPGHQHQPRQYRLRCRLRARLGNLGARHPAQTLHLPASTRAFSRRAVHKRSVSGQCSLQPDFTLDMGDVVRQCQGALPQIQVGIPQMSVDESRVSRSLDMLRAGPVRQVRPGIHDPDVSRSPAGLLRAVLPPLHPLRLGALAATLNDWGRASAIGLHPVRPALPSQGQAAIYWNTSQVLTCYSTALHSCKTMETAKISPSWLQLGWEVTGCCLSA